MPRLGGSYYFLQIYLNPHQQLDSYERQMIEDLANSKHKGKKRTIGEIFGCSGRIDFCDVKWRVMNIEVYENRETMKESNKTGYKDENGESTWNEDYPISIVYEDKRIYDANQHSNKRLGYFLHGTKINVIIYE